MKLEESLLHQLQVNCDLISGVNKQSGAIWALNWVIDLIIFFDANGRPKRSTLL